MKPRILYIGASHPQRVAVRELVDAGFDVHVTDRNAEPPCAAETPHVHQLDATDTDGAVALARRLNRSGRLVGAYGIADYAFASVAAVNRILGGRSSPPDALATMVDKALTKDALELRRVPMPATLWAGPGRDFDPACARIRESTVKDVVVKPANVHASQGVARVSCNDAQGLDRAVKIAGKNGAVVLVEEYLNGDICNLDALAIDGEAIPVSMTYRIANEKLSFLPAAQIQPAWHEVPDAENLTALAQEVCEAFGYRNGPFTIDYIRTPRGPKVLEVSPHFHSIALEMYRKNGNPLRAWFRYLAGDPAWRDNLNPPGQTAGAIIMLRAVRTGRLAGISSEARLSISPDCRDYIRLKPDGTVINSLSAAGGLLSLAWFVGGTGRAVEKVIRDHLVNVHGEFGGDRLDCA